LNSSDNNFLGKQNSGIILPKEARNYFNIKNLEGDWYDPQFLLLSSKKPLDVQTIINQNKNKKYSDLSLFVKDVFQDNIVLSDLTFKENDDWLSFVNNVMSFTLSNDINYILPIIINLRENSNSKIEIEEDVIQKPEKK
jgi:hypothetical protein